MIYLLIFKDIHPDLCFSIAIFYIFVSYFRLLIDFLKMVSIILPIYNCAPWLEACVRSVIAQTFTDWELIGIDDESSDNSASLFAAFADADPRIRLIRAPHGGLAKVRNIGIENAKGEYITFLDSDDLWPKRNLEYLFSILKENDAQFACGAFLKFFDKNEEKALRECNELLRSPDKNAVRLLSGAEAVKESLYQSGVNSSACGKLFHRDILKDVRFTEGEIYEDLDFFYRVGLRAAHVAVSSLPAYLYRQHGGSITHIFGPQRLDVLKVTERMCNYLSSASPDLMPAALDRRFSANFNMLQEIEKYLKSPSIPSDERDFFEGKLKGIRGFLGSHAARELKDKNVRLKNKAGALLYLALPYPLLRLILTKL